MSGYRIQSLAETRLRDFVAVYNRGRRRWPRFTPLTEADMMTMIHAGLFKREDCLVSYESKIPSSICRISLGKSDSSLTITDFALSPGKKKGGDNLIGYVLDYSTANKITRVRAWLPQKAADLSDLLNAYTFDIDRIHLRLSHSVSERARKEEFRKNVPFEAKEDLCPPLRDLFFDGTLEIQDIRENEGKAWDHCVLICDDSSPNEGAACYWSSITKQHAWIFALRRKAVPSVDAYLTPEILETAVRFLGSQGVRFIRAEIDADQRCYDPFRKVGFEKESTNFELFLSICHSER